MHSPRFSYPAETLQQIASDILDRARKGGASSCETDVSDGFGQNVTVRKGEVETIEYNRDKGLSVTVYIDQKRGHASTSDFSSKAVGDAAPVRAVRAAQRKPDQPNSALAPTTARRSP